MKRFLEWWGDPEVFEEMANFNAREPWKFRGKVGKDEEGHTLFQGEMIGTEEEPPPSVRQVLAKTPEGLTLMNLIRALGAGPAYDRMDPKARSHAKKSLRAQVVRWKDKGLLRTITDVDGNTRYTLGRGRSLEDVAGTQMFASEDILDLMKRLRLHWGRYVKTQHMGPMVDAGDFTPAAAKLIDQSGVDMKKLISSLKMVNDREFRWEVMTIVVAELGEKHPLEDRANILSEAIMEWWGPWSEPKLMRVIEQQPALIGITLTKLWKRREAFAVAWPAIETAVKSILRAGGKRGRFILHKILRGMGPGLEAYEKKLRDALEEIQGRPEEKPQEPTPE